MLKCLRRILEMRGSAGLYVTTNGTTSLEALDLVYVISVIFLLRHSLFIAELHACASRAGGRSPIVK